MYKHGFTVSLSTSRKVLYPLHSKSAKCFKRCPSMPFATLLLLSFLMSSPVITQSSSSSSSTPSSSSTLSSSSTSPSATPPCPSADGRFYDNNNLHCGYHTRESSGNKFESVYSNYQNSTACASLCDNLTFSNGSHCVSFVFNNNPKECGVKNSTTGLFQTPAYPSILLGVSDSSTPYGLMCPSANNSVYDDYALYCGMDSSQSYGSEFETSLYGISST